MDSNKSKAPLMYGIVGPDGAAYIGENCVASSPDELFAEVNGLNDSPDAGYKIVALGQVYLEAAAPQVVADERAALRKEKEVAIEKKIAYEHRRLCNLVSQYNELLGVEDSEDRIADAHKGINKLQEMLVGINRAAAPVQAQEPVYQVSQPFPADPANTWRDASSDAYDMSHPGRRRILYRAPVQPVAVPDGLTGEEIVKAAYEKFGIVADDMEIMEFVNFVRSAPAAQGDAKDAERWRYFRDSESLCGEVWNEIIHPDERGVKFHAKELDYWVDSDIAAKAAS